MHNEDESDVVYGGDAAKELMDMTESTLLSLLLQAAALRGCLAVCCLLAALLACLVFALQPDSALLAVLLGPLAPHNIHVLCRLTPLLFNSRLPQVPSQPRLLLPDADPVGRRTNDRLLLLRSLQPQVERRQLAL